MDKKTANIFKGAILFIGLGIYALAFCLVTGGKKLPANEIYLWVMIGIVYLAFFFPIFFNGITFKNFARHAGGVVLLWNADLFFCFVSILFAILVYQGKCSINTAVIIECVMFFVILIFLFVSLQTSSHIQNVQNTQTQSLSKIMSMRSSFDLLNMKMQATSGVKDEAKKKIASLTEDAKYISPVEKGEAFALEGDIIAKINEASNLLDNLQSPQASATATSQLDAVVQDLSMKINTRKMMRN